MATLAGTGAALGLLVVTGLCVGLGLSTIVGGIHLMSTIIFGKAGLEYIVLTSIFLPWIVGTSLVVVVLLIYGFLKIKNYRKGKDE